MKRPLLQRREHHPRLQPGLCHHPQLEGRHVSTASSAAASASTSTTSRLQWGTFKRFTGIFDQTNVPEAERKPVGYYDALYGVSGLQPSNVFVEDGTFTKLREVSLSYRLSQDLLSGIPGLNRFNGIALNLVGRNLFTWSDYRGYDPDLGEGGGDTGSAAVARVDGYNYPNFRTITAAIEFIF